MNVAGLYELLKIPYTGAGPLALGIALNKPRVKEILTFHGIKTPRFKVFGTDEQVVLQGDLAFPLIVKPSHEDASVGIDDRSVVIHCRRPPEARPVSSCEEFDQPALVEEYIDGRELNVAILGNQQPDGAPDFARSTSRG